MNLEDFKRATIAQVSELGGFWTFATTGTTNIYDLNVTTSSGNITVVWSDGSSPNIVSSGQPVSHTYTI